VDALRVGDVCVNPETGEDFRAGNESDRHLLDAGRLISER
jgi:hypothetical protein